MAKRNKPKSVPFGKRIDINVSVLPYVETERHDGKDHTILRFDVEVNKEHVNQYEAIAWFLVAEGSHWGEQSEPEWEALQVQWKSSASIARPSARCGPLLTLP